MKIYRTADPDPNELADVTIDNSTVYSRELMGKHLVESNWISAAPLDLTLGDYIVVGAEKLYLNRPVTFEKVDNMTYKYAATFEGEVYELYRKIFMHLGAADFSYFGDPEGLMLLIVENLNSIDSGWTLNIDLPVVYEPQLFTFSELTCRIALTQIIEGFGLEFRLLQKEIIVRQDVGFESIYSFEYGRHEGLYNLIRQNADSSEVVTRLYGFGGDKNISSGYRVGKRKLGFDTGGFPYVEANVETYGVREGTVTFSEIYPKRTGSITTVVANNKVQDSTLDFDINAQPIGGVKAKIVFKSGALSGYEFEIENYDHALKQITFIPKDEANGAVIPDTGSFQPELDDTYTLIGIDMPEAYVIAAEAELLAATQETHIKMKSPQAVYGLGIDEKHVKTNGIALDCGMRVSVKDTPIGLDEQIRIYAISFPLVNPANIVAQIADTIPLTNRERLVKAVNETKRDVVNVDRTRAEDMRESTWRFSQLRDKIYDPDGYFDLGNIKPASIETGMLSVGSKSQDFALNGVEIEPNYLGDPNAIRISAGELIHFQIEVVGLGFIWEMDATIIEDLVPATYYYVYARCNRSALTGTWVISDTPLGSESEAGFYHFWLGLLYPENDGLRYFMFTKGMTFIVGDTITAGKIQSRDGKVYLGLEDATFNVGQGVKGMDWNVTNADALTIRGAILVDAIFADTGVIQNLRVKQLRTADTGQRIEIRAFEDEEELIPAHNMKFYDADDNLVFTLDSEIDTGYVAPALVSAGIKIQSADDSRKVVVSRNGIMSEGSYMSHPGLGQYMASSWGVLKASVYSAFGVAAGVIGWDADPDPKVNTFGGLFNTALIMGLHVGIRSVTSSTLMLRTDTSMMCYNSNPIVVSLPNDPKKGRIIYIKRTGTGSVTVSGNGQYIIAQGGPISSIPVSPKGLTLMLQWDGSYWQSNGL